MSFIDWLMLLAGLACAVGLWVLEREAFLAGKNKPPVFPFWQ